MHDHRPPIFGPLCTPRRAISSALPLALVFALAGCDEGDEPVTDVASTTDDDADQDQNPDADPELATAPGDAPEPDACVPLPVSINPRLSLIDTTLAALTPFTMTAITDAIAVNAGYPSTPVQTYNQIINNFEQGGPALGSRCDDELSLLGGPGLNGYPLMCPRVERTQDFAPGPWFPLAAVNRFDLAPADGSNCGEQRLIMASHAGAGGTGRMFMIFEAVIPNPDPSCGLQACRPIAEFWENMSTLGGAPATRAAELQKAFLTGHPTLLAAGFGPFMSADNLTFGSGQVRTNSFDQPPWTLRDHKFGDSGGQLVAFQTPVEGNVFGDLWNDSTFWPQGPTCRTDILAHLGGLLGGDVNMMGLDTGNICWAAESIDDPTADYEAQLLAGGGPFINDVAIELGSLGSALNPAQVTRRATYVGSCMGCHQPAATMSTRNLGGGVVAELSRGFIHVDDNVRVTCVTPLDCWEISDALKFSFLPHREATMVNYLMSTACSSCAPMVVDGSVDEIAANHSSSPVRVPNIEDEAEIAALLEVERTLELQQPPSISGAPASRLH